MNADPSNPPPRTPAPLCREPLADREIGAEDTAALPELIDHLYGLRDGLGAFYRVLLRHPLDDDQRRALSARLFDGAPRFVRSTARALARSGELFADVPVDPEALAGWQELADVLDSLAGHFELLGRLARDTHTDVQCLAIQQARTAVRQGQAAPPQPAEDSTRGEDRQLALAVAAARAPRSPHRPGRR